MLVCITQPLRMCYLDDNSLLLRSHQAVGCSGVQLNVCLWLQFLMRQILGAVLVVCSGSLQTHCYELKNQTELLFCITEVFV